MSADSARLQVRSLAPEAAEFDRRFAALPELLRQEPYRAGLPGAGIWQGLLSLPVPFAREFWMLDSLGRVGASVSASRPGVGFVGFFEVDLRSGRHEEASRALLSAALAWLRERGVKTVYGPVNYNTWFPYRFRLDETDARRFPWEPVNPPEYPALFVAAGFEPAVRFRTDGLDNFAEMERATRKDHEAAVAKGFRFRDFEPDALLQRELPLLYSLSMKGFQDAFLFEPIPFDAFKQLYVPLLGKKTDLGFSHFVLGPDGREVGFFFSFRAGTSLVLKSMAVDPEMRGGGLSNALMNLTMNKALRAEDLTEMITALVRDGNRSGSFAKKVEGLWKHEYAVFKKEL